MVKVLITCTFPRADDFISDLKNYDVIARPALSFEKIPNNMPEGTYDAMLLSSRHAVIDDLPLLPVVTVGEKTAILAKEKGHDVVQVGQGGVQDLDFSLYSNILYPCALEPTCILDKCIPWSVYRTIENSNFSIDDSDHIICVFSVKAAKIISKYDLSNRVILCLSQAIADVFSQSDIAELAVCMRPRYDDMILLILKQVKAHT